MTTRIEEFRRGLPVLLGGMLGVGLGVASIPFYTAGVFMVPLGQALGWSRTSLSLGLSLSNLALASAGPFVGWLSDRHGARRVALVSLALLAAGYFGLSRMSGAAWVYVVAMTLVTVMGAGSSPVTFTRVVSAVFVRARGLALGLMLLGTGAAAALAPPFVDRLITRWGWRAGFVGLGIAIGVACPLVALLLGRERSAVAAGVGNPGAGLRRAEAVRTRQFWILAAAFLAVTLAVAGPVVHFVPMLIDGGMAGDSAARTAGSIGIAVILGRVVTGALVDRLFAPIVTVAVFGLSALGCAVIALGGPGLAWIVGPLLGFSLGAEIDLNAFLTARYFGLASYGEIYGVLYGVLSIGAAISPLAVGFSFDRTGSYGASLWGSTALLVIACVLVAGLGPYPAFAGSRDAAPERVL